MINLRRQLFTCHLENLSPFRSLRLVFVELVAMTPIPTKANKDQIKKLFLSGMRKCISQLADLESDADIAIRFKIKSNHILLFIYTGLADVIVSVAKCLCF